MLKYKDIAKELDDKNISEETPQKYFITYFKKKLDNKNDTEVVLNYVTNRHWSKNKKHVVSEDTINHLGFFVSKLNDEEQQKFAPKFYKLAADRDSSLGCRNYAICLLEGKYDLEKSANQALTYINKAVELDKKLPEKHRFKFLLVKIIFENKETDNLLPLLFDYVKGQLELKKGKEAIEALNYCGETLIPSITKKIIDEPRDDKHLETTINEIDSIINLCKIFTLEEIKEKINSLNNKFYYLIGRCYELLETPQKAWPAYATIIDTNSEVYCDAAEAKKRVLKNEFDKMQKEIFGETPLQEFFLRELNDKSKPQKREKYNLTLWENFDLPANFAKGWSKRSEDNESFHIADQSKIEENFEKRKTQIESLITAKETEIELYQEHEKSKNKRGVNSSRSVKSTELKKDLKALKAVKEQLEKKYHDYLPENRKVFRRHKAEQTFFDPLRSKKLADIVELAKQIVDYRYNVNGSDMIPIKLEGYSSRLLISAEKLYQNAIIHLSGKKKIPILSIPVIEKIDGSNYGPHEIYDVSGTKVNLQHITNPYPQRLGRIYLPNVGTYDDYVYSTLKKLSEDNRNKEQQLATFMIRYGNHHTPVKLKELETIYNSATENDVNDFHEICFLVMEKEQAQWLSSTEEDIQLGLSVAQARCAIMIKEGFLSFEDAFINKAEFGIYSRKRLYLNRRSVRKYCKHVDELYLTYLQSKNPLIHNTFFKETIITGKSLDRVLTREQAHQDLKEVYGGDSDTESDGYDSDVDYGVGV